MGCLDLTPMTPLFLGLGIAAVVWAMGKALG